MLTEQEARSILNLNPDGVIGKELAERQFKIIYRLFLHLHYEGNNLVYVADEVGLGKTYIAAGISILLRHFGDNPENFHCVIVVPKKNLQDKWKKDLNNFINNNYLINDDAKSSLLLNYNCIKDKISTINPEEKHTIFRMTSFSHILSYRENQPKNNEEINTLIERINIELFQNDEYTLGVLKDAKTKGYFKNNNPLLRKLIAYLLNIQSEKINCLIFDEAHNYKHGIGCDEYDHAIRNEITARFLGAYKDKRILEDFPYLKLKIKFPLADKIICLSATPKDRNLYEIKQQLSSFTNQHPLSDIKTNAEIAGQLNKFLIRGNLEYNLDSFTVPISRNQCRKEHRDGNVNKSENAEILELEDGFQSLFWQLLQYKSIKHLDEKHGARFEIGMLAGFESYQIDIQKKKPLQTDDSLDREAEPNKEYELIAQKKNDKSQDIKVIEGLIKSYKTDFNNVLPPHPKQTKLVAEIIQQMKRHEKSIIFVRRVATAYELEKRLIEKYEREIVVDEYLNFNKKYKKYYSEKVKKLLEAYKEKEIINKLPDFYNNLISKQELINYLKAKDEAINNASIYDWFLIAYQNPDLKNIINQFIQLDKKKISNEIKEITIKTLDNCYIEYLKVKKSEIEEEAANEEESINDYFFIQYFKKDNGGFSYKNKIYRENWFDFNFVELNNKFRFLNYDTAELNQQLKSVKRFDKKHQQFNEVERVIINYWALHSKIESSEVFDDINLLNSNTFLTILISDYCYDEFNLWLKKRTEKNNNISGLLKDLQKLNHIIKNIFRNGTGLLPGFVADSVNDSFTESMLELIIPEDSPFNFLLNEIRTIIKDYDLIVTANFGDADEPKINTILKELIPILGITGQDKVDRGIIAARFRMPGFPYVLITTDIFREGEDLHTYCQNIYHYGIGWNPSDMEQRTGRIDRINSLSYRRLTTSNSLNFENKVHIFYPYLQGSVEVNQVIYLLKNIDKFIETFNNIEERNEYESQIATSDLISNDDIPKQITKRLKSKYDIDNFEFSI